MSGMYAPQKTTHFEFMGPIGSFFMILGLPVVPYMLYYGCNAHGCSIIHPSIDFFSDPLFDGTVFLVTICWILFQAALYVFTPAQIVAGMPLVDGSKLNYNMNGLFACTFSTLGALALHLGGVLDLSFIYNHFLQFITSAVIISYLLSIYLYVSSFWGRKILAVGGNSGYPLYDFFIGRELNPRIGNFDLKFFCELRPGLIGWIVINIGLAAKQFALLGYVTNSMALVLIFQTIYVFDAFTSEPSILSTMDIIQDGFGFMLAFGDLAWVPFTYTFQARYLVDYPVDLSMLMVVVIVLTKFIGFRIFRGANAQKDMFKRDPKNPAVANLQYLTTKSGGRLLCDGWWAYSRHVNYLGDLLMALSWCLATGFGSILTYFYVIYFAVLLIHRERRDDHKCHLKYGEDWERYRKLVPYRIVPYLY